MSVEVLNSALVQLRGKAHEIYGIMNDIHRHPATEGDADKIINLSVKLAQLEGAVLTLEQYAPEIVKSVAQEQAMAASLEPEEPEDVNEGPSHDELMDRSSAYKKSVEEQQQTVTKIPAKKKGKKR